jgi:response regulator of citrate/malate metabolism
VIDTLIVEDDFRVARVHAEATRAVPGFRVVGVAHTASAALSAAAKHQPDLVLLDLYLPDASGLEVMRRLRAQRDPPDVIMLTAAQDMATVRAAMRGGVVHYLIKPFDLGALRERLLRYAELHQRRGADRPVEQRDVDQLFGLLRRPAEGAAVALPKGHSRETAKLVLDALRAAGEPLSAVELAERVGVSRATAQRYLSSLVDAGEVRLRLRYGSTGRPEHRYELELAPPAGG